MRSFVICSFYTKNTPYEDHAQRLIASCEKFAIPYDIVGIKSRGSWIANCAYKAEFLRDRIRGAPLPMVWADSDAEIVRYPIAFEVIEDEFAIFRLQRSSGGMEVLSGTIFMQPTSGVSALLDDWVDECKRRPAQWDQKSLQTVLAQHTTLRVHFLSEPYCCIKDPIHKRMIEIDPVILHHQASRQARRIVNKMR